MHLKNIWLYTTSGYTHNSYIWNNSGVIQAAHFGFKTKLEIYTSILPGARMVAQLVHVWVVLGHNGDGVTLLADDQTGLLLRSIPQVNTIILAKEGSAINAF